MRGLDKACIGYLPDGAARFFCRLTRANDTMIGRHIDAFLCNLCFLSFFFVSCFSVFIEDQAGRSHLEAQAVDLIGHSCLLLLGVRKETMLVPIGTSCLSVYRSR